MAVACVPRPEADLAASRRQLIACEEDITFPTFSKVDLNSPDNQQPLPSLLGYSQTSYVALDLRHGAGDGGSVSSEWGEGKILENNGASLGSNLRPSEVEELLEHNLARSSAEQLQGSPSTQSSSEGRHLVVRDTATAAVGRGGSGPHVATGTHKSGVLSGLWACLGPVVHLWKKDKKQQVGRLSHLT